MGWYGAGGWWILWPLGWLVFLFLIFAAGRRLIWGRRWGGCSRGGPDRFGSLPGDRAHGILRERLARGEIDQAEYDRLREILDR